jgi:hypothetical protein
MEGFEHVVKVALEAEGLIVAGNLKFPVKRKTRKAASEEHQTHGYEVDLVGARRNKLVLASVKSFFGSQGVSISGFRIAGSRSFPKLERLYAFFNEPEIQQGVIQSACDRFGYTPRQIELRLYVGKFKGKNQGADTRHAIAEHLLRPGPGLRPVKLIGLDEIVPRLFQLLKSKTYTNDPVVMTLRALRHAGVLPAD